VSFYRPAARDRMIVSMSQVRLSAWRPNTTIIRTMSRKKVAADSSPPGNKVAGTSRVDYPANWVDMADPAESE